MRAKFGRDPMAGSKKVAKVYNRIIIGVNRPAIVREIPQFGIFPAFPHFCQNVPHFWLYFEITKIAENRNNISCTLCENVGDSVTLGLKFV